eukprot:TRINITY_DN27982_c2_g1_i5.p4 TRINITY_DN27982_c2_g1~~TRINITY_DN27982_c2_g1_i5.p4  ORF type:complete len:164 (+),score=4.71 TRINITY_DN27982_c2_g1_i5:561-1052(+)
MPTGRCVAPPGTDRAESVPGAVAVAPAVSESPSLCTAAALCSCLDAPEADDGVRGCRGEEGDDERDEREEEEEEEEGEEEEDGTPSAVRRSDGMERRDWRSSVSRAAASDASAAAISSCRKRSWMAASARTRMKHGSSTPRAVLSRCAGSRRWGEGLSRGGGR